MTPDALTGRSCVLISPVRNAAVNLAVEEWLLSEVGGGSEILFLYENDPAVVIGRFQNPWKECRTGLARRQGVPVMRRISGGGTVVHGAGNLNLAVIAGRPAPAKAENMDRVIRALGRLGAEVFRGPRFDLFIQLPADGSGGNSRGAFKISGSAFRQTSRASMHHATLLVNADLGQLKKLLRVPARRMVTRSVSSIPSPVANLADSVSGLAVGEVTDALAREWGGFPPAELQAADYDRSPVFRESLRRLLSEEWIWGKTPPFREFFDGMESLGGGGLDLHIREGRIEAAAAAGGAALEPDIAGLLSGRGYHAPDILKGFEGREPPWLTELALRADGDLPEL